MCSNIGISGRMTETRSSCLDDRGWCVCVGVCTCTRALAIRTTEIAIKMLPWRGHLGGSVVEHLPWAPVVILGSWDQVPHRAPHREPASPSALSLSLMNKSIKSFKENPSQGGSYCESGIVPIVRVFNQFQVKYE